MTYVTPLAHATKQHVLLFYGTTAV